MYNELRSEALAASPEPTPDKPFSEVYANILQVEYSRLFPKFVLGQEVYFYSRKGPLKGKITEVVMRESRNTTSNDVTLRVQYTIVHDDPTTDDSWDRKNGVYEYAIEETRVFATKQDLVNGILNLI